MGIAHLVQAVAIVVISQSSSRAKKFEIPLVTHFLDWSKNYP
jgi:hypothetical protein